MTETFPGTAAIDAEFEALTNPLRRELLAHCYRMLGSVQDAEDQVQETYLRAWRSYEKFEGRSSVRTWMYTIATRTCLTALEQRTRRPLPTGLGAPESDPTHEVVADHEVPWLEPLPDVKLGAEPENSAVTQDSVRLAFVAALQHLTPPQRAVLILRDVLALSAAETAAALDTSVASANSALQRARVKMAEVSGRTADDEDPWIPGTGDQPLDAHEQELLAAFMAAFERYDTRGVVQLLKKDATWEMPPFPDWYDGAEAIGTLISTQCPAKQADDLRLVATSANGQPAAAAYLKGEDGVHRAFQIHVLDLEQTADGARIRHVACFFDLHLFDQFGLPRVWTDELGAARA